MENLTSIFNSYSIGQVLLVGFWGFCVIGFTVAVLWAFGLMIHNKIMSVINKLRSHIIE